MAFARRLFPSLRRTSVSAPCVGVAGAKTPTDHASLPKLWARSKFTKKIFPKLAPLHDASSFQKLERLMDQEDGRSRVGNSHLVTAINGMTIPTRGALDQMSAQLWRYKKKKKLVTARASSLLVFKMVNADFEKDALTLLMDKKKYGLYPGKTAYKHLMQTLLSKKQPKAVIAAFERMVLDSNEQPTSEICHLLILANKEAGCANRHHRVVAFCKAAKIGGVDLDDVSRQTLALDCIRYHDWDNAKLMLEPLAADAEFDAEVLKACEEETKSNSSYSMAKITSWIGAAHTPAPTPEPTPTPTPTPDISPPSPDDVEAEVEVEVEVEGSEEEVSSGESTEESTEEEEPEGAAEQQVEGYTIPAYRLKIRGVPSKCTPQDILGFFKGFDFLPQTLMMNMKPNSRNRVKVEERTGFAWLGFASEEEASRAMKGLHGKRLYNSKVACMLESNTTADPNTVMLVGLPPATLPADIIAMLASSSWLPESLRITRTDDYCLAWVVLPDKAAVERLTATTLQVTSSLQKFEASPVTVAIAQHAPHGGYPFERMTTAIIRIEEDAGLRPMSATIRMRVPYSATKDDVIEFLKGFNFDESSICMPGDNIYRTGYCYVTMGSAEEAERVAHTRDNKQLGDFLARVKNMARRVIDTSL